ncbi:MAG TPA: DUF996 domain-containing protein [Candidatus Bathyarchaeia archaeon]|nr:DUF996 domain-containing protein [Candidatus Bathyarchaeia archaeon]
MTLATNKQLGFVAAILTVIGLVYSLTSIGRIVSPLPSLPIADLGLGLLFGVLGLISFLLFLIAMYGLSKDYQDSAIFNYVLYGIIVAIVLGVIVVGITIFIVFSSLGSFIASGGLPSSGTQFLQEYLQSLFPLYLGLSFVGLVPALFNMLAFKRLANKSGVRLFRTVGLLGVVAAAVTIALWFLGAAFFYADILTISSIFTFSTVGSAVSLVAWILGAKAFHSITVPTSETYWTPPAQGPPPPAAQIKYCPYCGTANTMDAEYCASCGKKQ